MEAENPELSHKKRLSELQKWDIIAYYNINVDPSTGKLVYGGLEDILQRFEISRDTLYSIVRQYRAQVEQDVVYPDLKPKYTGNAGLQSNLDNDLAACILEYNYMAGYEQTISQFCSGFNAVYQTNTHFSTMYRYTTQLGTAFINSYIKPSLTKQQKMDRLRFILDQLEPQADGSFMIRYHKNRVHLDEKWFYLCREVLRYRVFPGPDAPPPPPAETTHHKKHIPKIMYLVAVGIPQEVPGHDVFDGKIGIWPVAEKGVAKRSSVNRPAGAEVVNLLSMDADEFFEMMTMEGGVFDLIKQKMPWMRDEVLYVQYDGATPHTGKDNPFKLSCVANQDGWNIEMVAQPAQSPDLNLLNLGLFHSLQRRADEIRQGGQDVNGIMERTERAFEDYDSQKIVNVEAVLCEVYRQVLRSGGGNQYKIPHTGVRKRQHAGEEPIDRRVSLEDKLAGEEALNRLLWGEDD